VHELNEDVDVDEGNVVDEFDVDAGDCWDPALFVLLIELEICSQRTKCKGRC
jgi:hypothetical protein